MTQRELQLPGPGPYVHAFRPSLCGQAAARPPTQAAQQPRSSAAQLEAIQELEVGMHLLDDAYLSSPELHRPPEASPHSHWQGD